MYPEIKAKVIRLLNYLKVQIIFITRFIVNKMYPTAINAVTRLFNDPNRRVALLIVILLVVVFVIGIGNDYGGG